MRLAIPLLIGLLLLLPAASTARTGAPGDGTLSVKAGRGVVELAVCGTVIGRIEKGKVRIEDPLIGGGTLAISGAESEQKVSETATRYEGRDIRFRAVGGSFQLRIEGSGLDLSAVGRGRVSVRGDASNRDGTYSPDGSAPRSLESERTTSLVGGGKCLPSGG